MASSSSLNLPDVAADLDVEEAARVAADAGLDTRVDSLELAPPAHNHAGEAITSGTVADARIAATIARDSEVTAAVAAEATARDIAIGVETSARTAADALLIPKTLADANSVLYATADDTPAALAMAASTILARLASGSVVAATPAELRTLLALVVGTNVQAWDVDLDSLASVGLTAAGLALLDDANAAAQRATLGLVPGLTHMTPIVNTIWSGDTTRIGNGFSARTQNLLQAIPVPLRAGTLSLIGVYLNSNQASNTFRLGIYNDAGGYPGTLLVDAGTVDGSAGAPSFKTLSISNVITDGIYWLCCVEQGGAAGATILTSTLGGKFVGFYINSTGNLYDQYLGFQYAGVTGALPGTWTATLAGITQAGGSPSIFVRYA